MVVLKINLISIVLLSYVPYLVHGWWMDDVHNSSGVIYHEGDDDDDGMGRDAYAYEEAGYDRPQHQNNYNNNGYYEGRNPRRNRKGRRCNASGNNCADHNNCCSNVCDKRSRRCCLSEGLVCDNSHPRKRGLRPCCPGLFCDQLSTVPQITVCQERLYKYEGTGVGGGK